MSSEVLKQSLAALKGFYSTRPPAAPLRFSRITYGLSAVGVQLSDGSIGTCYSASGEAVPRRSSLWEKAGDLLHEPVWEVAAWALNENLYDRAIGIATINALSAPYTQAKQIPAVHDLDEIQALQVKAGETVGLIGYMVPVVERILKAGAQVRIVDRDPHVLELAQQEPSVTIFPTIQGLKGVDHIMTTASCLVYHSFEEILKESGYCKSVVMIGPSAGLPPDVLFSHGVVVIGHQQIMDADRTFTVLAEGGLPGSKNRCAKKIWFLSPAAKRAVDGD